MSNFNDVNTLNKFGVYVDGENRRERFYHLPTRYRVRFIGMGVLTDGNDLTMSMSKFDSPKGNFESKSVSLVNGDIKYPGKWTWGDINFSVFNTYDNSNYRALYNQIQRQKSIYDQTTGDAPNNYKFTSVVEHTDGHQKTLSYWVMEGCWLQKAQTGDFNNGSYDAMTIDCTMSFDNATLYDKDGNMIPSTDSGIVADKISAFSF